MSLTSDPTLAPHFNPSNKKPVMSPLLSLSDQDRYRDVRGRAKMDSEIRRLEDRIDAVNREGQLRLDAVMARIEGKFDAISEQNRHMESSITSASQDLKGLRSTIIITAIASVLTIAGVIYAGQALWAGGFSSGQSDRPPSAQSAH